MRKLALLLSVIITLCTALPSYSQGGNMGSTSSPITNRTGQPLSGVKIAFCQPLATTAASVISNVAILTMASNPVTAGFVSGMTIMVAGFTGGDTYFNGGSLVSGVLSGGYTILSVTSTTVTYSLVHANAAAGTNGTALQQGNASTSCAGLSTVYSNPTLATTTTNPATSDGNGNWNVFAAAGLYYAQFYGTGITTTIKQIAIACVPSAPCVTLSPLVIPGATSGSLSVTAPAIAGSSSIQLGVTGNGAALPTFPAATDTVVELTQAQVLTNKTLTSPVINGTPTGTGIATTTQKKGSGGGTYTTSSTGYVDVELANLAYTVTIPVGWKLIVAASGSAFISTGADSVGVGLTDGSLLTERVMTFSAINLNTPFALNYAITGDGASHTVKLQYKTFNAADAVDIRNASATDTCVMDFLLIPSN